MSPRPVSPLNDPVWRLALTAAIAVAAAFAVFHVLGGGAVFAATIAAVPAAFAWITVIRLLLLDSRARRFWVIWLAAFALPLLITGSGGGVVAAVWGAAVFLIFRRYKPYRHLTAQRRAGLFFVALVALGLSIGMHPPAAAEGAGYGRLIGRAILSSAAGALMIYWAMTAIHLVLGMRLHFLRLRPKLLMSAVFVAIVPLLLVLLMSVTTLLGVLGATRATSGRRLLLEWGNLATTLAPTTVAQRAEAGAGARPGAATPAVPAGGIGTFTESFAAREGDPAPPSAPPWLPDLWRALHVTPAPPESTAAQVKRAATALAESVQVQTRGRGRRGAASGRRGTTITLGRETEDIADFGRPWAPTDTTLLFHAGAEVWVLRLERNPPARAAGPGGAAAPGSPGSAEGNWSVNGCRIVEPTLTRLAGILDADVGIYSSRHLTFGDTSSPEAQEAMADTTRLTTNVLGHLARKGASPDSTSGLWRKPVDLGAAVLNMVRITPRGFVHDSGLLHVKLAPADIWHELASGDNEFNQVVLIGLLTIAGLFLLFVAFTVLLGVRIAAGITSAVGELRQGTERLAEGDLDTRIEVPNEDEFGELADAFNDMAAAVKRGREEAVERERLDRELRMAREIQERLLPHEMPEVPGFEVTGTSVPSLQVGGDYFDFLDLGDGKLGVAIGDVSGKGVPAALLMANLQALLQGQVIHPSGVSEIVARINDLLARSIDPSRFASFFYGVLDRNAATFTSTNAGHNPPLLLRRDGKIEQLTVGGLLLGMLPAMTYEQQSVAFAPGDVLVMYTDGITEAVGPALTATAAAAAEVAGTPGAARATAAEAAPTATAAKAAETARGAKGAVAVADESGESPEEEPLNMFGDERLLAVLRANADRSAGEIREAILAAVREHAAGVPPSDDITLVVIRRRP